MVDESVKKEIEGLFQIVINKAHKVSTVSLAKTLEAKQAFEKLKILSREHGEDFSEVLNQFVTHSDKKGVSTIDLAKRDLQAVKSGARPQSSFTEKAMSWFEECISETAERGYEKAFRYVKYTGDVTSTLEAHRDMVGFLEILGNKALKLKSKEVKSDLPDEIIDEDFFAKSLAFALARQAANTLKEQGLKFLNVPETRFRLLKEISPEYLGKLDTGETMVIMPFVETTVETVTEEAREIYVRNAALLTQPGFERTQQLAQSLFDGNHLQNTARLIGIATFQPRS